MSAWVVISRPDCPWCDKAKALLKEKQVEWTEFDIYEHPPIKEFLLASGLKTVPQIFLNGLLIGGHDDLVKLIKDAGK